MSERGDLKEGKVTLDIGLKDLIDVVSKSTGRPIVRDSFDPAAEDIRKAWFNHTLLSMEKLNDLIETVRRVDIVELRAELKKDVKQIETDLKEHECEFKDFKKEVIDPLHNKVLMLTIKLGIWSTIAGFVGSGIMGLIIYLLKTYLLKSPASGGS